MDIIEATHPKIVNKSERSLCTCFNFLPIFTVTMGGKSLHQSDLEYSKNVFLLQSANKIAKAYNKR